MWKLNQFLSGDDEEREESFLEEESDGFCSLSPTQRMYAFAASLVAGLALMFLACPPFGTAFLIGPGRQLGMMFDPARIYATAIYIGCVVLALICALLVQPELYSFRSENGV